MNDERQYKSDPSNRRPDYFWEHDDDAIDSVELRDMIIKEEGIYYWEFLRFFEILDSYGYEPWAVRGCNLRWAPYEERRRLSQIDKLNGLDLFDFSIDYIELKHEWAAKVCDLSLEGNCQVELVDLEGWSGIELWVDEWIPGDERGIKVLSPWRSRFPPLNAAFAQFHDEFFTSPAKRRREVGFYPEFDPDDSRLWGESSHPEDALLFGTWKDSHNVFWFPSAPLWRLGANGEITSPEDQQSLQKSILQGLRIHWESWEKIEEYYSRRRWEGWERRRTIPPKTVPELHYHVFGELYTIDQLEPWIGKEEAHQLREHMRNQAAPGPSSD